MARHIRTILTDDLDGRDADETITFGLDGKHYEIDLASDNAAQLRDDLAPWIAGARARKAPRTAGTYRPLSYPAPQEEIRTWARQAGHQVAGRGRISRAVVQAYRDAHQ